MAAHVARPEHAFIGNHTYAIEWLTDEQWQPKHLPLDADGATYATQQTIYMHIRGNARESHYQEILLHELCHGVWDSTMLTHADLGKQEEPEEFVISIQSPALLFVFRQNPHIVKYLMSDPTLVRD